MEKEAARWPLSAEPDPRLRRSNNLARRSDLSSPIAEVTRLGEAHNPFELERTNHLDSPRQRDLRF
jgi:hypothetical protein